MDKIEKKRLSWETPAQKKNLAWVLPRPKPDKYPGGMPLHAEKWLIELGKHILSRDDVKLLSLFCGRCSLGFRVDVNPEVDPDLICDAHKLSQFVNEKFDIILADPPYSDEEARRLYGKTIPKLSYKKWTAEATKLLRPNGLLIVYHKRLVPNPNPNVYSVVKRVFIGHRVWHVPRIAIYFQKRKGGAAITVAK